jgi:flagellar biosynthesis GTPase FlhF
VRVVFFFDGMTQESQRDTWKERRQSRVDNVLKIFETLHNNSAVQPKLLEGMLPSLVAATCSFVAKYVCGCDVHISVSDCDVEVAHSAWKEDCFAILSQDTDFVILQSARHFLTVQELNLEIYSREGLLKFLGLESQQLCLLASLLGNDTVPVSKEIDRETDRQRDRQRDRQTDRQSDRQTQRERETDSETDRQRDRQTDRQREIDRQTERQTDRQRDRQKDIETDRETETDRQTDTARSLLDDYSAKHLDQKF